MSIQVVNPEQMGQNVQLYPEGTPQSDIPASHQARTFAVPKFGAASSTSTSTGRLAGKVAIVTGAGSGYGEGIAQAFAREGAQVIIADINVPAGEKVAGSSPSNMVFRRLDVTKAESWQEVMQFATEKYGFVDVLVNNAGASYVNKPTMEVTEAEFDKVMLVNLKSVFHSTNHFIPPLITSERRGVILNISSTGATRPRPGLVWYNASKAAVSNATKALAAEYGPKGIRVNAICPLLGNTGLFSTFTGLEGTDENVARFVGDVPMGRLCTPGDVASAAVWLCADEAAFVTGQCIQVDGGKTI